MSDLSEQVNRESIDFVQGEIIDSVDKISQKTIEHYSRISAQELHKYVVGLIGVFMLILTTYPIAFARVSQTKKFAPYQSHLKSLTPEYQSIESK